MGLGLGLPRSVGMERQVWDACNGPTHRSHAPTNVNRRTENKRANGSALSAATRDDEGEARASFVRRVQAQIRAHRLEEAVGDGEADSARREVVALP